MSMQRILNYGSSLQAYALRRLIEATLPGITVSFVDYRPGTPLVSDEPVARGTSRAIRALTKIREYNNVDAPLGDRVRFFNHKRTYARRNFPLVGIERHPNYDLNLDVHVIGSDEVFNCVQANTNVGYSRDLFGRGSQAKRLVSYAASFGNTTYAKIEQFGLTDQLAEDFARFDQISVRDENSRSIVHRLTGSSPPVHVDPAIAYDYMNEEPRIPTGRIRQRPYVLVYGYSGRLNEQENEELRAFAKAIGADIISLGGVQACADRFVDCSAFELLAYFRDAEAVVTDTFHGTILAMINQRPFCTIVRRSEGVGYGNEEKLGYLLDSFGLSARRADSGDSLARILNAPISYPAVNAVIDKQRERSRDYLAKIMV